MHPLQDPTAIVTGGSRGIGRAIAERLASDGARVLITGRDEASLSRAANAINGEIIGVVGDIGHPDSPQAIVARAMEEWGRIDVLVNNAATHDQRPFLAQQAADWEHVFRVNLTGAYALTQFCARQMVNQQRGSIVTIASYAAHGYELSVPAFGASQAALVNLTRQLAVVLGPHGVRANSVSPGVVATGWTENEPESYERFVGALSRVPLRRLVSPHEVANLVSFLVSDDASAITGGEYVVDAGLLADLAVIPPA